MSNNPNTPKWKQALKWAAVTLATMVALDWLLDGRLRKRFPGKRKDRAENVNV